MKSLTMGGLILIGLFFCSCREEQVKEPDLTENENYFPLKVGNYWVYQNYNDNDGEIKYRENDTVRVTKDTIINSQTYKVLEGDIGFSNRKFTQFLRESGDYVLDFGGDTIFSFSDRYRILHTFIGIDEGAGDGKRLYTEYQMEEDEEETVVPAGNFKTLSYRGHTVDEIRETEYNCANTFYAKDIGRIKQTWCYATSPNFRIVKELIDYSVE